MREEKKQYYKFCKENTEELSLFYQPYWLNAVAGENGWDCVIIASDTYVKAIMPFAISRKYGMTVINNPALTPHTGVHFIYPHNLEKGERKLAFENKVSKELIAKIPNHLYFHLCFNPSYSNWLAFHWEGFKQSTKYTYVVPAHVNINDAFDAIKSKTKNTIRKAKALLSIAQSDDIGIFYMLNSKTFSRQGKANPLDLDKLQKIDGALSKRAQRKLYLAHDENQEYHAGVYVVNDYKTSYCLAIGSDPKFRSSGAISLLLWEAIKDALKEGRSFDFEGSMMHNIEPIFRSFGAQQVPYYRIYGSKNKWTHALFALLGKW